MFILVFLLLSIGLYGQTFSEKMGECEKKADFLEKVLKFGTKEIPRVVLDEMNVGFVSMASDLNHSFQNAVDNRENVDVDRFNRLQRKIKKIGKKLQKSTLQQYPVKTYESQAHAFSFCKLTGFII